MGGLAQLDPPQFFLGDIDHEVHAVEVGDGQDRGAGLDQLARFDRLAGDHAVDGGGNRAVGDGLFQQVRLGHGLVQTGPGRPDLLRPGELLELFQGLAGRVLLGGGHCQAGLGVVPLFGSHAALGRQLPHPLGIRFSEIEVRVRLAQSIPGLLQVLGPGAQAEQVELGFGQGHPGLGLAQLNVEGIMVEEDEDIAGFHPAPLLDANLPDLSAHPGRDVHFPGFDRSRSLDLRFILDAGAGRGEDQAAHEQDDSQVSHDASFFLGTAENSLFLRNVFLALSVRMPSKKTPMMVSKMSEAR